MTFEYGTREFEDCTNMAKIAVGAHGNLRARIARRGWARIVEVHIGVPPNPGDVRYRCAGPHRTNRSARKKSAMTALRARQCPLE